MLTSRCVSFYETIEASSKLCIRFLFFLIYVKMTLTQFLPEIYFLFLIKMLVKKQMKYFDVPLEHEWKVPVLQEL